MIFFIVFIKGYGKNKSIAKDYLTRIEAKYEETEEERTSEK